MTHSSDFVYADMVVSIAVLCYVFILFPSFYLAGQLCAVTVSMCACEPEACTLLRYGIWPATADKPQTAFSIPLLELFVCLSLECQVSGKTSFHLQRSVRSHVCEVNILVTFMDFQDWPVRIDVTIGPSTLIVLHHYYLWNRLGLYSCMQNDYSYFSIKVTSE